MSFPRQFTIRDLLILTVATAVILALGKHSRLAAMLAFPALIGAFAGHCKSQSVGGTIAGAFYACFCCFILGIPAIAVVVLPAILLSHNEDVAGFAAMATALLLSAVGGYAGGAIEKRRHEKQTLSNEDKYKQNAAEQ